MVRHSAMWSCRMILSKFKEEKLMGYWNHYMDEQDSIITCRHCGKKYKQWTEEQIPGFREMDYDTCPYCNQDNGRSMSYEFHNEKLD